MDYAMSLSNSQSDAEGLGYCPVCRKMKPSFELMECGLLNSDPLIVCMDCDIEFSEDEIYLANQQYMATVAMLKEKEHKL